MSQAKVEPLRAEVVCTINRVFLEAAGANLYTLLFVFRDELVDTTVEKEGRVYVISSVEISDDKIVAFYRESRDLTAMRMHVQP